MGSVTRRIFASNVYTLMSSRAGAKFASGTKLTLSVHRTSGLLSRRVLGDSLQCLDRRCRPPCSPVRRRPASAGDPVAGDTDWRKPSCSHNRRDSPSPGQDWQAPTPLSGIAFGQVGIRQAYGHRATIGAGQLGFPVVILREIKVVH